MARGSKSVVIMAALAGMALAQSHAQAQDTIKVGMNGALTGPCSVLGKDALAGVELALEEINGAGGIKGKKIELLVKDDECKPPVALNWAKQFVEKDRVVAYIPSTNTTPNLTSLQVTVPAGVPHIIAGTTSDVVCPPAGGSKACDSNVIRLSILNSWQADAIVKFVLDKQQAKKVALMYDSTEYGQDGSKLLLAALEKRGVKPVYAGTFELAEKNFKPYLTRAKEAGADMILTWTLDFVVAQIAIQKKELGMGDVKMIGSSAITGGALRTLGKEAVEGVYMADGMPAANQSSDPKLKELMTRYQKKYGVDPKMAIPYWTTTYYDAMHLLARKLNEVGPDRAALAKALSNAGTFPGTQVTYSVSPDKRNGRSPDGVYIVQVKDGALVNAQ
jgi:branched-chain amino acid transport system substrate-binding protein